MFCLITSIKLSRQLFEFSLKVKVMGSNPGYLLKSFLLYRTGEYCDSKNRYPIPLIIIIGMIHAIVIGFSMWTMSVANNARKEIAKTPAIKQIDVAPITDNRF